MCCPRSFRRAAVNSGVPRSSRHGRRVRNIADTRDKQVVPEVVTEVTEKATLILTYNGKNINNGEVLTPSETQVHGSRPLLPAQFCSMHWRQWNMATVHEIAVLVAHLQSLCR